MENHKKIDFICRERDGLRQEIIELEKSMHKTFFAFLVAGTAFLSIYIDQTIIADAQDRWAVLFVLAQFIFFLPFF